jgi:hypothetical protein
MANTIPADETGKIITFDTALGKLHESRSIPVVATIVRPGGRVYGFKK